MNPPNENTLFMFDPYRDSPERTLYAFKFDTVENLQRWTNSPENLRRLAALITRAWTHDLKREGLIARAKTSILMAIEFRTTGNTPMRPLE